MSIAMTSAIFNTMIRLELIVNMCPTLFDQTRYAAVVQQRILAG